MVKKVVFVERTHGFVNAAVENKLKNAGFEVIRLKDEVETVKEHRYDADIFLYFPEGTSPRIDAIMRYLTSMCRDDHKILCLVGEASFINRAKKSEGGELVHNEYPKPVNINLLVEDMLSLSQKQTEFKRLKTILIIDDDNDYRAIIKKWLNKDYRVDDSGSAYEALATLEEMHPDLILLDYDMPGVNGGELLEKIRSDPASADIPAIFLLGRNDPEGCLRVIRSRPDGYLLKEVRKRELLDNLSRFFSESILGQ